MKVCTKCKEEKKADCFHLNIKKQARSWCKICNNAYSKIYSEKRRRAKGMREQKKIHANLSSDMWVCSKCREIKEIYCFDKNKTMKMGIASECKDCRKKYRALPETREKNKLYMETWKEKNKEIIYMSRQKFYINNKSRLIAKAVKIKKKHKEALSDYYIVLLINSNAPIKLDKNDIPKEFIEFYRTLLKLKRLKQKQKEP